jgi:hypothetical protein
MGPDIGHVSKPYYGLIFASDNLLAHDAMSYAWLRWNYEYNTPLHAKIAARANRRRTVINEGFVDIFFTRVDGYNLAPKRLPTNDCLPKIYLHRAMKNYVDRVGGCPQSLAWNQITKNPDPSVEKYMLNIMTTSGGTDSISGIKEKGFVDGHLKYDPISAYGFQIRLNGQFKYRITDLMGSVMEFGTGKNIQRVGTQLPPGAYILNVNSVNGDFNRKIIMK